jgi:hypothetical protein
MFRVVLGGGVVVGYVKRDKVNQLIEAIKNKIKCNCKGEKKHKEKKAKKEKAAKEDKVDEKED